MHIRRGSMVIDIQRKVTVVAFHNLFLKLYNMGIRSKLLRIVIGLHHNLTGCVLHNGYHSACFPVLQGTRQRGVISPLSYLCFIDDLLNEICECGAGFKIDGVCYAAPSVCDDMLFLALSKMG